MAALSDDRSYYALLGVAPTASDEEVRRAFRQLATTLHPDKAGAGAAEGQLSLGWLPCWACAASSGCCAACQGQPLGPHASHPAAQVANAAHHDEAAALFTQIQEAYEVRSAWVSRAAGTGLSCVRGPHAARCSRACRASRHHGSARQRAYASSHAAGLAWRRC